MRSIWVKIAMSVLTVTGALLLALILNSLIPTPAENAGATDISPFAGWSIAIVYVLLLIVAIKAHSVSGRLKKLEVERVTLRAQYMAKSLWQVESATREKDMEGNNFTLLRLRHMSWNEWTNIAVREWHPQFYESTLLRAGRVIELEATSDPLNRAEKEELCSYLHIKGA